MSDARLVETHTAYVLLLDGVALKWKKPLDLGFVDFRSVEARARACADEVRLNSRLAPDVYEGVCRLQDDAGGLVEPVVRMRRLPDSARLSALLADGIETGPALRQLAVLLADFHRSFAPLADADAVAGPQRLRELWLVGLDALVAQGTGIVDELTVSRARRLVLGWLDGRGALLEDRIAQGWVRDGHGDLLTDDVFVLPDGPRVLDCLEFDEGLRCGDVLSDVASLLADLERLGALEAADEFLAAYELASGDRAPASLRHLYVAYRAQVRAKVACVRADQTTHAAVRDTQAHLARTLVALMVQHLEEATVRLVLVGGLPGSGKSTLARGLAERTGAHRLGTDALRQEVVDQGASRYSPEQVQRVYDRLLAQARSELERGRSVVLDASWADADLRAEAASLARETSSALTEICCVVDDATAANRLSERPADHESDADADVRARMAERFAAWPSAQEVDTRAHPEGALRSALRALHEGRSTPPSSVPGGTSGTGPGGSPTTAVTTGSRGR